MGPLAGDALDVDERRPLARELSGILARDGAPARRQYGAFTNRMRLHGRAHSFLTNAEPYILYSPPSAERTTSIMEREMREVNRRTDVGARWSVTGVTNLTRLGLAKRHNPDDYERVWSPLQAPAQLTVSTC